MFTSSYQGNYTGSSIIGPPYWLSETITFAKASNQQWETAFPAEPRAFVAPSIVNAAYNVRPNKVEQWNFSLQKAIPILRSALTVSYVGNRGYHLITKESLNEVPPGTYTNLQNAKPYPRLGNVFVYQNTGNSWYNSLQAVMERRFHNGLHSCMVVEQLVVNARSKVNVAAGDARDDWLRKIERLERFLDALLQLGQMQQARVKAGLLQVFRSGNDAVVGAEGDDIISMADFLVEIREEIAEVFVQPD
jgi:hypothetical protein